MKHFYFAFLCFVTTILAVCCNSAASEQERYQTLLGRAQSLEHRHCQLNASIDSLWDVTSQQLDKALPKNFPAIDRGIFLRARNADHIRMFMSFKQLSPDAQSIVNEAGKYDTSLAAQVRGLLEEKQSFEREKIRFLKNIGKTNTSEVYAKALQQATAVTACQ